MRALQLIGVVAIIPQLDTTISLDTTKSEGLAVDWLNQQVYWTDIDSSKKAC